MILFLERVRSNVFENGQAHSLIVVFVSRAIFYLKRLGGSPVTFKKCFDFWEREWWSREGIDFTGLVGRRLASRVECLKVREGI